MNEQLRKMAEEAGLFYTPGSDEQDWNSRLEAFARLVAEDAAKICQEKFADHYDHSARKQGAIECAEAIMKKYS
jgi:hypothetical protein